MQKFLEPWPRFDLVSETGEESRLDKWELQMLVRLFDLSSHLSRIARHHICVIMILQNCDFLLEGVTLVDYFLPSGAEVPQPDETMMT